MMDAVVAILLIVIAIAVIGWLNISLGRRYEPAKKLLTDAARLLSLPADRLDHFWKPHIRGIVNKIRLEVKVHSITEDQDFRYRITATPFRDSRCAWRISSRKISARIGSRLNPIAHSVAIKTGDPDFDDAVTVQTDTAELSFAVIDASVRGDILLLVQKDIVIDATHERVTAIINGKNYFTAELIASVARRIHSLCSILSERFATGAESDREFIWRVLTERISKEHDPRIRVRILEMLGKRYAADGRIIDVLTRALDDPDHAVQLAAAEYLGPPAGTHVQIVLEQHHQSMTDDLVMQALGLLRLYADNSCIPALTKIYRQSIERRAVRIGLITIFSELGDGALTPFLSDELQKNDGDILTALIHALGSVGTVDAVEPLYLAGKRSMNPIVRSAVRDAIERIQARLGTVESGWLSLVRLGEYEGSLSLAKDAGEGALSVVEKIRDKKKRK